LQRNEIYIFYPAPLGCTRKGLCQGRTGTVVGCFLARHGIAHGKKALAMISRLRLNDPRAHEPSPDTPVQRDMVASWKEGE
jgi:hypothetical protein